jgi:hypothetical protein
MGVVVCCNLRFLLIKSCVVNETVKFGHDDFIGGDTSYKVTYKCNGGHASM